MATKLSDALVRKLAPPDGDRALFVWDTEVRQFGVRVTPAGARAFIIAYRIANGTQRQKTIGAFGVWTTTQAREEARRLKRLISQGEDPVAERRAQRQAPDIAALADR